jgi:hypothetical protein
MVITLLLIPRISSIATNLLNRIGAPLQEVLDYMAILLRNERLSPFCPTPEIGDRNQYR